MEKEITALFDRRNQVIMDWSPKAGCTILVKMFFRHMGLLEAALSYHSWIHEYRMKVFYKDHPITIEDICNPSIYKFKIVRNPFFRAVSSYIHTMKKEVMHGPLKQGLWRWNADISFNTFLHFLSETDLKNCDPHYGLQKKNYEYGNETCFNEIIRLENLAEKISVLNKKQNLHFNLDGLNSHHHSQLSAENKINVANRQWSNIRDQIPEYKHFYTDKLVQKVYDIYREDFDTYGYSDQEFPV